MRKNYAIACSGVRFCSTSISRTGPCACTMSSARCSNAAIGNRSPAGMACFWTASAWQIGQSCHRTSSTCGAVSPIISRARDARRKHAASCSTSIGSRLSWLPLISTRCSPISSSMPGDETITQLRHALRTAAHILGREPQQLAVSASRAVDRRDSGDHRLLDQARARKSGAWLRPLTPSLISDPALLRTLEGHANRSARWRSRPTASEQCPGRWTTLSRCGSWTPARCCAPLRVTQARSARWRSRPTASARCPRRRTTTLKVWELETGTLLRTLEGHTSSVDAVAITPDGKRAVSGSSDTTLKVWELETGVLLRTLEGHAGSGLRGSHHAGRQARSVRSRGTGRSRCGNWRQAHCCARWKGTQAQSTRGDHARRRARGVRLRGQHAQGVGAGDRCAAAHAGRARRLGQRGGDHARRQAGGIRLVGPHAQGVGLGHGRAAAHA